MTPDCGLRRAWRSGSRKNAGSPITRDTCGACCGNWAGVANVPRGARWNATNKPSRSGSANAGRRLKKSPKRAENNRVHRRKRIEPAAASLPHVGPARRNSRAAISFQLENFVGHGRRDVVEFLFPAVPGRHPQPAGGAVSRASLAASGLPTLGGVGRRADASQSSGVGFCAPTTRTLVAGISSRLRSRVKPCRVSVGPLEAARTSQLLPAHLRGAQSPRAASLAAHAPPHHPGDRLLGASGALLVSLYYAKVNRGGFAGRGLSGCSLCGAGPENFHTRTVGRWRGPQSGRNVGLGASELAH